MYVWNLYFVKLVLNAPHRTRIVKWEMLRVGCAVVVYVAVRSGCLSFYLFANAFTLDSVVRVLVVVVVSVVTIAALKNSLNFDIEHIEFLFERKPKTKKKLN